MYSPSVLLPDHFCIIPGDARAVMAFGQASAYCEWPVMTFEHMQQMQSQITWNPALPTDFATDKNGEHNMHLDSASCDTAQNVEELTPTACSKTTRKKRRRGGARRGSGSSAQTPADGLPSSGCRPSAGDQVDTFHISSSGKGVDERVPLFGKCSDAFVLGQSLELCNQIIALLESNAADAHTVFMGFFPATKTLAFARHGCRIIQKAIVALGHDDQALLIKELNGSIVELYKSPHGNHVVAKMIEVMPPKNLGFLLDELKDSATVARHQYGCRLLERLIEHCPAEQVADMVEELLQEAEPLARHPYGNFVVQHILEHGTPTWKFKVAERIAPVLPYLATHRTASHVVQRAFECGEPEIQKTLVLALVNGEAEESLVGVACTRYGSFVVEELSNICLACSGYTSGYTLACLQASCDIARQQLQDGVLELSESHYGRRAVVKFGFFQEDATTDL